ncbi:MAG: hypothetical protein ABEN55_19060 [Bradymonadaceae bacterium]
MKTPSPTATAFPWDDLPSLTTDDIEIGNRLLHLLPLGGGPTLSALADRLTDLVGLPHTLDFHRLSVRDPSQPPPTFGDASRLGSTCRPTPRPARCCSI